MAAGGHHGLLAVVGGRRAAAFGKKRDDFAPFGLIKLQCIAEGFRHGFLGQIVGGRAQPARKDKQVTAGARFIDKLAQPAGVIPDNMLMQHADAKLGEFPAQKLGVGVEDIAEQKFGADTDNFRGQSRSPLCVPAGLAGPDKLKVRYKQPPWAHPLRKEPPAAFFTPKAAAPRPSAGHASPNQNSAVSPTRM